MRPRVHANFAHHAGSFRNAERAAARALSLPIYPELRQIDQDTVCQALASALAMPAAAQGAGDLGREPHAPVAFFEDAVARETGDDLRERDGIVMDEQRCEFAVQVEQ
jgi:hypothetical protein